MTAGRVAIVSQSGSVAIALSQDERRLGLAYVVSSGNETVLTAADYLSAFAADAGVSVIAMFLETIRDPARFAGAAAEARRRGKAVVVLKVGRTAGGRSAVSAHTGALAGEHDVYEAFFRRHGVLSVRDFEELAETVAVCAAYGGGAGRRGVDRGQSTHRSRRGVRRARRRRGRRATPFRIDTRRPLSVSVTVYGVTVYGSGKEAEGQAPHLSLPEGPRLPEPPQGDPDPDAEPARDAHRSGARAALPGEQDTHPGGARRPAA
jgi:hypothetical protein